MDTVNFMDEIVSEIRRKDTGHYKHIVAIQNGGIPFGKYLESHLWLDLKPVKIQFRCKNHEFRKNPIVEMGDPSEWCRPFLLVDDIVDSGKTVDYFENNFGFTKGCDFDVATLHWCKELSPNHEPTYYADIKSKSDWIVYPWERSVDFDEWWELALL